MFSAIFSIILRLLTRAILNLALQAIEKVPDVSRNSARCNPTFVLQENRAVDNLVLTIFFNQVVYPADETCEEHVPPLLNWLSRPRP